MEHGIVGCRNMGAATHSGKRSDVFGPTHDLTYDAILYYERGLLPYGAFYAFERKNIKFQGLAFLF
ncbi:hypothetical protein DAMNIGENAA_19970 [Desulforhabdus amnigena]|uniref:Uncharacterized protein n=1 Tax=Desulforhabdus amnigena TaxID=40218 RepID=A0A9W6FSX7_9BACT|nr:hypothetical protein DAMNIGENAA_19970 [Desulforhabdus amnigena]